MCSELNCKIRPRPEVVFAINQVQHRKNAMANQIINAYVPRDADYKTKVSRKELSIHKITVGAEVDKESVRQNGMTETIFIGRVLGWNEQLFERA